VRITPSGRLATTSVKVPPRSIQNCQPFAIVRLLRPPNLAAAPLSGVIKNFYLMAIF
jgi:hypothetical protein